MPEVSKLSLGCVIILNYLQKEADSSGWLSTVSWQSIVALDAFLIGSIIQGLITLNDVEYSPTRWQGTLFVIASVIWVAAFNVFVSRQLPLAESIFVAVHVLAYFPVILTLLLLSPKQSSAAVFTDFRDNGAGWPSPSLSVMVGQVSTMFVVLGESKHGSRETVNVLTAGEVLIQLHIWRRKSEMQALSCPRAWSGRSS